MWRCCLQISEDVNYAVRQPTAHAINENHRVRCFRQMLLGPLETPEQLMNLGDLMYQVCCVTSFCWSQIPGWSPLGTTSTLSDWQIAHLPGALSAPPIGSAHRRCPSALPIGAAHRLCLPFSALQRPHLLCVVMLVCMFMTYPLYLAHSCV